MRYTESEGVRYYEGDVTPGGNAVLVFGSNPEGRHGAGAAKTARELFGAVYGQGEGPQGQSYAIPTKDLRVKEDNGLRSIPPEVITRSVIDFYAYAEAHPEKDFFIAYRNTDARSLNGYTGLEMIGMFAQAGPIPGNVAVSKEWHAAGAEALRCAGGRVPSLALAVQMNEAKRRAMQDGTFMTAPDGSPTALSEAEWLACRTPLYRRRAEAQGAADAGAEPSPERIRGLLGVPRESETLLLSPSGRESGLPCGLYAHVRSGEFIREHGDWMKGESDLVLNSDGEPAVLWHGTSAEFGRFDISHAGDNTGITEYTDKTTGRTFTSDSLRTVSFSDDRLQAVSYAFLGWTQRLRRRDSDLRDASVALRRLWADRDLAPVFANLRREYPQMKELLEVDFSRPKPISFLSEQTRARIADVLDKELERVTEAYRQGFSSSVGSPVSNRLNNIERQADYYHYFERNLGRLRANDVSVETERLGARKSDFGNTMVHFFGGDGAFGPMAFAEGESQRIVFRADCLGGNRYADTLTDAECAAFLQEVRDGLDGCIRKFNADITANGFRENCHLHPAFLRMGKPLRHDYRYSAFPDKYIPNEKYGTAYVAARQTQKAVETGCDGVVYEHITDPFPGTTYGVFSTGQIVDIEPSLLERDDMDVRVRTVSQHTGAGAYRHHEEEKAAVKEPLSPRERLARRLDKAVSEGMISGYGELRDGLVRVKHASGKYNYVGLDGRFLAQKWFDSATDFRDGKATVTRGGTQAEIDTKGVALKVEKTERQASGQEVRHGMR